MRLYSIEVTIYATAYVKAKTPEQAAEMAKVLVTIGEITATSEYTSDARFEDLMASTEIRSDVTLSPAMTVDHIHGQPEQVWPE